MIAEPQAAKPRGIAMSTALFAQFHVNDLPIPWPYAALIALVAMVFFVVAVMFMTRYRRCPSNQVLVIYGKYTGSATGTRCLHGGARLVLPLVQDYAYLNLEPIQIEIPLKGALSMENIRVNVPSVFTVAVGTDPETMQQAAIRLLGLDTEDIKQQASDIIL